jgi:hypothetical protein
MSRVSSSSPDGAFFQYSPFFAHIAWSNFDLAFYLFEKS